MAARSKDHHRRSRKLMLELPSRETIDRDRRQAIDEDRTKVSNFNVQKQALVTLLEAYPLSGRRYVEW